MLLDGKCRNPVLSPAIKIPFKGKPFCDILGNEYLSYTLRACQRHFLLCTRLLWKIQRIGIFCPQDSSVTHYSKASVKKEKFTFHLSTHMGGYTQTYQSQSLAISKVQLINPLVYTHPPISGNGLQQTDILLACSLKGFLM